MVDEPTLGKIDYIQAQGRIQKRENNRLTVLSGCKCLWDCTVAPSSPSPVPHTITLNHNTL